MNNPEKFSHLGEQAEQNDIQEKAIARIVAVQQACAQLFASSLIACLDESVSLSIDLWSFQEVFFSAFSEVIPVHTNRILEENSQLIEDALANGISLLILANHPPFEKTVSPSQLQLRDSMRASGRESVVNALQNPDNLPANIVRTAVINAVMRQILPQAHFYYHTVAARRLPPLDLVQVNDGSIVVPYAGSEPNGFAMLKNGLSHVFAMDPSHVVIGYPEGGNPQVIEELKPFHSGIIAAAAKTLSEEKSLLIVPIVMAVGSQFQIETDLLRPLPLLSEHGSRESSAALARTLESQFNTAYARLITSMGDQYFWKGMVYPFGGLSRKDFLPKN